MKDYLISMFIDNELNLDEKIEFVETVYQNKVFKEEAIDLLHQDKLLQKDMVLTGPKTYPPLPPPRKTGFFSNLFPPLTGVATAMVLIAGIFFLRPDPVVTIKEPYRFVLYLPNSNQAKIIGDFTDWTPVAMEKVGTSGYWSLTLPLPEGEHRYSYLVDNGLQIADPTVQAREQDDFGGENSIIRVNVVI